MKNKEWTPFQLNRLPESGYWLSLFNGGNGYTSIHLYCVMNGCVKYIRKDEIERKKMFGFKEWSTLQWNCMPTKNQISKPGPNTLYFHFKSINDIMRDFSDLPDYFYNKAPNDF